MITVEVYPLMTTFGLSRGKDAPQMCHKFWEMPTLSPGLPAANLSEMDLYGTFHR